MSLRGKVVLITGASSGIGAACAQQFAEAGCNLVLAARRLESLQRLAAELEATHSVQVFTQCCDVRVPEDCDKLRDSLPGEFKIIDVLVNNAGLAKGMWLTEQHPAEDVDQMIDTNVKGVLNMLRVFLPDMKARDSGTIVNIGSIAGKEGYANGSVYCASKHALEAITRSLRIELAPTALRVLQVCPGLTAETDFALTRFGGDAARADTVYKGLQPLTAADVADAVVWAASRPPHVQIADILMLCTAQATATTVARK